MNKKDEHVCPSCGQVFSAELGSCFNCGTWLGLDQDHPDSDANTSKLEKNGKCPYCQQEHSAEANFCPNTGKPIHHDEYSPKETQSKPSVEKSVSSRQKSGKTLEQDPIERGIIDKEEYGDIVSLENAPPPGQADQKTSTSRTLELQDSFDELGDVEPDKEQGRQLDSRLNLLRFVMMVFLIGGVLLIVQGWAGTQLLAMVSTKTPTPSLTPTSIHTPIITPSPAFSPSRTLTSTYTITPSQTPSPSPKPTLGIGSTMIHPRDGMELVYVPGGEFLMGLDGGDVSLFLTICPSCDTWSLRDQRPQREVFVDSYWIDRTEVTNAQFDMFVTDTGYITTAEKKGMSYVMIRGNADFVYLEGADWRYPFGAGSDIARKDFFPVTQVSWDDAVAYCAWAGRRLPTEAEWEKAARGATGWLYPWGDTGPNDELLNYNFNYAGPIEVGSFPDGVSSYGAFDMAGNVWEWVADFYSEYYYQNKPERNPEGPDSGDGHPLRGGSWASERGPYMMYTLSTFRLWNYPYIRSNVIGFRCANSN